MLGRRSHIVLIGFMGSGKSTIGKLLATRMERPFVDMDELIVQKEGKSIAKIFEEDGEEYFRTVESNVLNDCLASSIPSIISTGGGAPCFNDGMTKIRQGGFSFYLKVGKKILLDRIFNDSVRPLAMAKTKSELKQFIDRSLKNRESYYLKANQTIRAFGTPERIVNRMLYYWNQIKI